MSVKLVSEKKVTFRMDEEMFWSLKRLAVEEKTNVTTLLDEAVKDLLKKKKLK